jgi:phosphoserine phosphatase RsbU/P
MTKKSPHHFQEAAVPDLPQMFGRRKIDRYQHAGKTDGPRVLLVDDQRLVAAAVDRMLAGAKDIVLHAVQDAASALSALHTFQPTVILQDLFMPDADGLDLVLQYRKQPETRDIPVLVLSSEEDPLTKARAFSCGANDYLIKLPAPEEMIARLRYHSSAYQNQLQRDAAYRQLSRELDIARKMLLGLLPAPAVIGRARFEWLFQASSYVSGDCFDYFPVDAHHTCFYVADVSGHGVSAAMLAFSVQHQMRASEHKMARGIAQSQGNLRLVVESVLAEFNRRLVQMRDTSLYVTIAFGLLDQRSGMLALARAGHPAPLLVGMAGEGAIRLGVDSLPAGLVPDAEYEASLVRLEEGSRIYLYSDGITEAENPQEESFGQNRLEQLLLTQRPYPLGTVRAQLSDSLRQWRENPEAIEDDITFLAVGFGDGDVRAA